MPAAAALQGSRTIVTHADSSDSAATLQDVVARNEARAALVARYALIISVFGHAAQIALFAWLERPGLSLLNIGSVAVLAYALWRLQAVRAVEMAYWLAVGELLVINIVASAVLGLGAGFLIYPMIATGIIATVPFCPAGRRLAMMAASFTILMAAILVMLRTGPTNPMDAARTTVFLVANLANMSLGIVVVLWFYAREIARAEGDLERAYQRSEDLLVAILPASIAGRLKAGEKTIADDYGDATVLFADIVGFTEQAARVAPDELVRFLDALFSRFDALALEAGVEKIKTIGDAYMAVAGLPAPRPDHADAAARFALAVLDAVRQVRLPGDAALRVRIGLHSGRVVGGVIGTKRMTFDLWGDVVNTAARMESTGEPGCIQISDATRLRLRGEYRTVERGMVEVKGKGAMRTWFLGPA